MKKIFEKHEIYIGEIYQSLVDAFEDSQITPYHQKILQEYMSDFVKIFEDEHFKLKRKYIKPKKRKFSGFINEQDIEHARNYPIKDWIEEHTPYRFNSGGFVNCFLGTHEDKTPSMKYNSNNTVHCFGCHAHLSVIDVEMNLSGCDFKQAVKNICKKT